MKNWMGEKNKEVKSEQWEEVAETGGQWTQLDVGHSPPFIITSHNHIAPHPFK